MVLSKKPITEVQTRINALLLKAETADIEKIKHTLESEAYKNQRSDDERDKEKELVKKAKDEQLKERFNQELKQITSSINHYLEEQQLLVQRVNQFSLPQMALGQYSSYSQTNVINQSRYSIQQYDIKIHFLSEKRKIIRDKLHVLEQHSELHTQKEQARAIRKQAGIAYQNTQENIEASLSEKNKELLRKNLNAHIQSLSKKRGQLRSESERLHFSLFLNQLFERLPTMQLKPKDLSAGQALIKLIKQHLQHHNDLLLFQETLNKKKSTISNLLVKLHGLKENTRILAKQNPSVLTTNKQLTEKIKVLNSSLEENSKIQKRLSTSVLLLLGLSCAFSIPFILALNGTLAFLTPVLLYCLVSIPPALLVLSTIAVGIASLVYFFRVREHNESIKKDKELISSNIKQWSKNELESKELELLIIPALEEQIKKEETKRDELISVLEKTQKLLKETFAQAQQIIPATTDDLSLFKVSPSEIPPSADSEQLSLLTHNSM